MPDSEWTTLNRERGLLIDRQIAGTASAAERARQRGKKPKLGTFGPRARERANDPRQGGLFV